MKYKIKLAFIATLLAVVAHAQTELRYDHYTIANGLSSNFTKAVAQDNYGLLWIGTIDGLNCFNGYDFTTFFSHDNDSTSLSDNSINDLLIDKKGTLWIATNKGLNKYLRASNKFQRFFYGNSQNRKESLFVNSICEDAEGNLWLGTDKGIRVLNPSNNSTRIPQIKDESLRHFVEEGIGGIYFDSKGMVWLGAALRGGFRLGDAKTFTPVAFTPEKNKFIEYAVTDFYEDKRGLVWILSQDGLYSYDREQNLFMRFTRSDIPGDTLVYTVTSILENKEGSIWVSLAANPPYYTSIAKVNPQSGTFIIYPYVDNDDRGLAWSWATFIFQDKSGIYWVGTSRGLDKMDPLCQQFKLYQQYTNLKYSRFNNIYKIIKDGKNIWLATDGMGLIRYDLTTKQFEHVFTDGYLATAGLYSMLLLNDGNLLLGSGEGISFYNTIKKNSQLIINPPPPKGNGNSEVSCMINGDGDEVWIGFNGGGLMRYNVKTKQHKLYRNNETDNTSLCSDQVNVVFRDSKGIFWIGSGDGVNVFGGLPGKGLDRFNPADETFTHFSHHNDDSTSISENNIVCIAEDRNGILWIGTRNGGLNRFDAATGKFKSYTKEDGMPFNFITAIEVDNENKIWTSSFTNGLACLDDKTNEIKAFDVSYGLQNFRFNRQSSFKSKDGELFFGGVSGFNSFYPDKLRFNTEPPRVLITSIKINNKAYIPDASIYDTRKLHLEYDQSELQFDFAALNYSQTNKNQYAYQLVGYDKNPIMAGTLRSAKYTNLDPGEYTFKVRACNNDGVWNEKGTSVSITILPPWWKTWWAYSLYFIAIAGSIWYYIKWRERTLKARQKVLEKTVQVRTADLVAEKKKSDDLLLNILPEEVAEELKAKGNADAKLFEEVTVMFTDFKGFTQISEKLSPSELVAEIHTCFKAFDNIITKNNIEKIKTIGDSYMCAGGLPVANKTNATDVVSAAMEIQQFMQQHLQKRKSENKELFEIRIGVHTGTVVAGIVGVKKFAYDIWGDTVNIASRMESSSEAGKVNISGNTYEIVKNKFTCIHRGKIQAKNKGQIDMYFVEDKI